ncbi:hypothetical protein F2P81_016026 [Scophthalmus maximus]|uniref:Uncharacterized protein n=1 Tax=Scophthalmus maximus TaxID=52904 RepID=A0A6A4SK15_SCOMX|nr:hypothetical protein F2P81_016026 [Scophthalmus maximus]
MFETRHLSSDVVPLRAHDEIDVRWRAGDGAAAAAALTQTDRDELCTNMQLHYRIHCRDFTSTHTIHEHTCREDKAKHPIPSVSMNRGGISSDRNRSSGASIRIGVFWPADAHLYAAVGV